MKADIQSEVALKIFEQQALHLQRTQLGCEDHELLYVQESSVSLFENRVFVKLYCANCKDAHMHTCTFKVLDGIMVHLSDKEPS
jgi:hypothetical protein